MKVNLPADYVICPHCGIVLVGADGIDNLQGMVYSRVLSGKAIVCPSCKQKFTCKSTVIQELPKFPKIVETTCSNPECNTHFVAEASEANIIFECNRCGETLKYPAQSVPVDQFEIFNILSDVTLSTPLVSLVGNLAVTRMGLFLFIIDLKPGNDESKLGSDGDGLFERIKPYIEANSDSIKEKPGAILLQIMQKQKGFWSLLEKYVDNLRISPLELSKFFFELDDSTPKIKTFEMLKHGILSTLYGSITFSVREAKCDELAENLKWFVSCAKFYKSEYDALFFDSPVKYLCECGKIFKAYASAIGLPAICNNCGRKFNFRHRPMQNLQAELNVGIPIPREIVKPFSAVDLPKLKFAVCTSCNKWTWVDARTPVDTPICRYCKTPVKMGGKATRWANYICPYCNQTMIYPEILGGCEAVCKNCGESSIAPRSVVS